MPRQAALAVAALANGISMLVCYVVCDEECLSAARRLLALSSHSEWQHSPAGDTELSLYIKQGGEVESRAGVGTLESPSSPESLASSYWRATPLRSPANMYRRQSNPDCRADIVRCVEYKELYHPYDTRAVCDLIPTGGGVYAPPPHGYTSRVCVELRVLPASPHAPLLSRAPDVQPYSREMTDTPKESCTICVQSTPDVSVPTVAPRKSCLKKRSPQLSWSTSLPSIHHLNTHSTHIQSDYAHTDRVLHKISHDLDFLLNRTQASEHCTDHIEETPT